MSSYKGFLSTYNFENSILSMRMIPWKIKNLMFSNDVSIAYVIFHFQGIFLRGLCSSQFAARGIEPPGLTLFFTTGCKYVLYLLLLFAIKISHQWLDMESRVDKICRL